MAFCGDGFIDAGEQCDAGPKNGQQAVLCTSTCQAINLFCGNGIVDQSLGEQCDLASLDGRPGSGCDARCRFSVGSCGDGTVQLGLGEECDQGDRNGQPDADCDGACRWTQLSQCGDGVVDPGIEQCDAGVGQYALDSHLPNGNYAGTNCLSNCVKPFCGDGITELNEQCDLGPNNSDPLRGCNVFCQLVNAAAPSVNPTNPNFGDSTYSQYMAGLTPAQQALQGQVNPNLTAANYTQFIAGVSPGQNVPNYSQSQFRNIPTPARTPTGPGLVIFLASGAAAGVGVARRRLFKK